MSVHAYGWVLRHSGEAVPGRRLVLLALADRADDDGTNACPSIETLQHETKLSRRGVQYALRELEKAGRIRGDGRHPIYGTRTWSVLLGGGEEIAPRGVQPAANGDVTDCALTVLKATVGGRGARERAIADGTPLALRYKGAPVPEPSARLAASLVAEYARASGQRVSAWKGDGSPSEALRRVLGAVLSYPDETGARWREVMRAVLENPWWEGSPSIGVVFGPKVVEENLLDPARGQRRRAAANGSGRRHRAARDREAIDRLVKEAKK